MQKRSQVLCFLLITLFFIMNIYANGQPSLKDETRLPWAITQGGFIRDWLIVGGFPIQDGKGYDVDFLTEHQGELHIKPVEGMTHTLPDGSTIVWKPYHSPYNYINFLNVLKDINF